MNPIIATLIISIFGSRIVFIREARGRPRITAKVRSAMVAALLAYPQLDTYRAYPVLRRSRDGLAVALLLLNAAAKTNAALYAHTVPLLRAIVCASSRREWWVEHHEHPMVTTSTSTVAAFVEKSRRASARSSTLSACRSRRTSAPRTPPPISPTLRRPTGGAVRASRSSPAQRKSRGPFSNDSDPPPRRASPGGAV